MKNFVSAFLTVSGFLIIAFIAALARENSLEIIVACVAFLGFIAVITGLVIKEYVEEYKSLNKVK